MKYLVVSDIHSNLEAMQAVLKHARNVGYDQMLCAGDIVGYNANPMEVIDILIDEKAICIRGNHDREVARGVYPDGFNGPAAQAVLWTQANLWTSYRSWLSLLPQGPSEFDGFRLVHGSPRDEDEYVHGPSKRWLPHPAGDSSPLIIFFGHTHCPVAFNGSGLCQTTGAVQLGREDWMINPGSVGQPRDGDPRTSFVIWDQSRETAEFYRIPYNFQLTQKKILAAGLPRSLATRLG